LVFPLPPYPQSQGHILESLLRSKLEPDVEEWVEQGEALARSIPSSQGLGQDDLKALWDWVPKAAKKIGKQQCWNGDYTLAERARGLDPDQGWQSIETGLDRYLDNPGTPNDADTDEEDDGEEAELEEDAMEGVVEEQKRSASISTARARRIAPMSLENVHRFMTTGKTG
jgi:mediator of RNA polymerase II transcription subunit 8, fungi type